MVSQKLYPVEYDFLKFYAALTLYISVALTNTFAKLMYSTISTLAALFFVILLFKKEILEAKATLFHYGNELFSKVKNKNFWCK